MQKGGAGFKQTEKTELFFKNAYQSTVVEFFKLIIQICGSLSSSDDSKMHVRYRFNCTDDEFAVLKSYLSPEVLDGPEIGWEEHAEVAGG